MRVPWPQADPRRWVDAGEAGFHLLTNCRACLSLAWDLYALHPVLRCLPD